VLFYGNTAEFYGVGIYSQGGGLSLVNASLTGNKGDIGGGGIYGSGNLVITNAVMWGDSSTACPEPQPENCAEIACNRNTTVVSYSLVQGSGGSGAWDPGLGTDGGHNLDADPLFYGGPAGDLRLLVGSPAIDAGNSSVPDLPATDLAGNPRIQNGIVDMGAYEGGVAALYSYAHMDSIVDVPNDQGGWVRIYFTRSSYDDAGEEHYPVARYDIHRRIDTPGLLSSIRAKGEVLEGDHEITLPGGEKVHLVAPASDAGSRYVRYADRYFIVNERIAATAPFGVWEVVGNVSAQQQDHYIRLAPTIADYSETEPWAYSVYYISAHTTTPSVYFDSPPDSGYSVDNLPPGVPGGFVVAYNTGSGNYLGWDPCADKDFQYFKIYRGTNPEFLPGPENMVQETAGTEWNDPDYDGWSVYYKVSAVDHVGNESEPASPGSTTDAGANQIPKVFALHQNVPNPFNPTTTIRYDVPAGGGHVTLKVYDVSGRVVQTLVDAVQSAGQKTARWEGRNGRGERVATGIYLYRMEAPGFVETKKMVLLR
jgi:hypothetical protein